MIEITRYYGPTIVRGNEGENLKELVHRHKHDLMEASFYDCDLSSCYLPNANLVRAKLNRANLSYTDLRGANLYCANLEEANLTKANLDGANLQGACLDKANLTGTRLPHFQIPQEGDLIGYKKVQDGILKLLIPAQAQRTASLIGRKCRAEYVIVLEGAEQPRQSLFTYTLSYKNGETVYPDSYDDDARVECTHGIHFFLTLPEAKEFCF